jgi:hypothetical protein
MKYGIWIKDPDLKLIHIEADSPEEVMEKVLVANITLADNGDYAQIMSEINKRRESCD